MNDFHQVVVGPTHELGGTLDILLMSACSLPLLHSHSVGLKNEVCLTDHFPVHFNLQLKPKYIDSKHTYVSHNWRNLSVENVSNELENVGLKSLPASGLDVNFTVQQYNQSLSNVFLKYCPPIVQSVKRRPHQKWFTDELRDLKRIRRQAERRYRKYPTPNLCQEYDNIKSFYKSSIRATHSNYFKNDIYSLEK